MTGSPASGLGIEFRLSIQRALWGAITPALRAVALGWEEDVVRARFVFDRDPTEEEAELVGEVETEVLADLAEDVRTDFTITVEARGRLDHQPGEVWWAYVRHEAVPEVEVRLRELVRERPELAPLLESHVADYGELIPHLLMSEVVTWAAEHPTDPPGTAAAVLAWMNHWYQHGSDEVQNLVVASGVEAIPDPGQPGAELRDGLSAALWSNDPWNPVWAERRGATTTMHPDPSDRPSRGRVLVEPDELGLQLARGDRVTLLDVRGSITGPPGRPQYEAGHLPGAVFVELETDLSGAPGEGGRHPLPDPAAFQAAMRAAGVDDDVEVVAYDGASSLYAARLWWLLTDAGHPRVRVLDGGYAGWAAAGHPIETGPGRPVVPGGFVARPGHRDRVTLEQILADPAGFTLVDVRAAERYRGEVEPIDPVAGHIPGALNRPATQLLDAGSRFRPADEVAAMYAGIDEPVLYCGSGITAAQALLALEAAGVPGGRIYPGSWSDWIRDPDRPVATGPEPDGR